MKTLFQIIRRIPTGWLGATAPRSLLLALAVGLPQAGRPADAPKVFPTPEAAAASLAKVVKAEGQANLQSIFGPALDEMENPDRTQATNEFTAFAAALEENQRLVRESDTRYVLEVGANHWPFPIPIVRRDAGWIFDAAAGKEELLNRRIGKNELAVLEVMRAYVGAQREYAGRDRDGDQVLEYAQRLASSPGKQDGLHWPPDADGEISPLGPLMAQAQGEGYDLLSTEGPREPFHGYYFKILKGQGKHAPGGKYDYVINGNMIGGFGLVAWPAKHGESGVMTFTVNQQGRVHEKDLGSKTAKLARKLNAYDPDASWDISRD